MKLANKHLPPLAKHKEFNFNIWMTHATDLLTYFLGPTTILVIDEQPFQDSGIAG